jgi:hypothetical protein
MVQLTISDYLVVENLMNTLMYENLVSECHLIDQGVTKTFLKEGKEVVM